MKTPSKLVKITANRRIIPVRDPTSIRSPPRLPKAVPTKRQQQQESKKVMTPQQKVAALREALAADKGEQVKGEKEKKSVKGDDVKPKEAETASSDLGDGVLPMMDDEEFESIAAIADFISNSEPPQKTVDPTSANLQKTPSKAIVPSHLEMCSVEDEFSKDTYSVVKTTVADLKLPSGTIVTNLNSPEKGVQALSDLKLKQAVEEDESDHDDTPVRIPAGLKISVATPGMVKIQAGALRIGDDSNNKTDWKTGTSKKTSEAKGADSKQSTKVIELGKKVGEKEKVV